MMKLSRFMLIYNCFCSLMIKPNERFDIVCVNLEKDKERKAHMESILSYAKCKYEFFNAVDGHLVLTDQKNISEYSRGLDITYYANTHKFVDEKYHGVVGLKLTSYILYKKLENSGSNKPLLILEDDADLEADFVVRVEDTLSKMGDNWDILILNNNYILKDASVPPDAITGLREIGMFAGTYAYLINGCSTAKKLIDLMDKCSLNRPIDACLGAGCTYSQIKGYAYTTPLATHLGNVFKSNIPTSWFVGPDALNNSLYWLVKNNGMSN